MLSALWVDADGSHWTLEEWASHAAEMTDLDGNPAPVKWHIRLDGLAVLEGDERCWDGTARVLLEPEPRLDTEGVASALGVTAATVRSYKARGVLPSPDGHDGRAPWWYAHRISEWASSRPGRGVGGGRPRRDAHVTTPGG